MTLNSSWFRHTKLFLSYSGCNGLHGNEATPYRVKIVNMKYQLMAKIRYKVKSFLMIDTSIIDKATAVYEDKREFSKDLIV